MEKGLAEVVRTLITECGIGVNERTTSEISAVTPLHVAVLHGQAHLIPMLIALGADVNMLDQEKHCCPLIAAIILQDEWSVQLLIEAKANANRMSREGRGPMYIAAEKDSASILRMLVEKCGIDINAPATNELDKGSPLHVAAMFDNASSVAVLLQMGADIFLKDALGRTAEEIAKNAFSRKAYDVLKNHIERNNLIRPTDDIENTVEEEEVKCDNEESFDSADITYQSQPQMYIDEYIIDDDEEGEADDVGEQDREEDIDEYREEVGIEKSNDEENVCDNDNETENENENENENIQAEAIEDANTDFSISLLSTNTHSHSQTPNCNLAQCSASNLFCTCSPLKAARLSSTKRSGS